MRLCIISPINPRDNPYTKGTKSTAFLGGLRLKYWLETRTDARVDVVHSDVEDVYDIDYSKYDYVGISSYYPTKQHDIAFAKWIRKNFDSTIIFGGINPSFEPHAYEKVADIIVIGEGEKPLQQVVESEAKHGRFGSLDGTTELNLSEWREATFNLPYDLAPWNKIWEYNKKYFNVGPAIRFITTSVCKRKCIFCSSTHYIKKFKWLTTEQLRALCDWAGKKLPKDGIIILQGDDELYGLARHRFVELWEQGYQFPRPVSIQTEVNRIDEKMARILKDLGVFEVCLGVESFSENILREYRKKATVADNERCLEILLKYGIQPYANIILNGLGIYSSKKDVEYTIQRINYWKKRGVKFGINYDVIPLPGSDYWRLLKRSQLP